MVTLASFIMGPREISCLDQAMMALTTLYMGHLCSFYPEHMSYNANGMMNAEPVDKLSHIWPCMQWMWKKANAKLCGDAMRVGGTSCSFCDGGAYAGAADTAAEFAQSLSGCCWLAWTDAVRDCRVVMPGRQQLVCLLGDVLV